MLLTELVEQNIGVFNSKLTNTVTNQRKHAIWVEIADKVSSLGKCLRSGKDVKTKWSIIPPTTITETEPQVDQHLSPWTQQ